MPFEVRGTGTEVDTERMYHNVMEKYRFGGADVEGVYMDGTRRMLKPTRNKITNTAH